MTQVHHIAILPMLIMASLVIGLPALIIFAIVRKKWALLFIPLGLVFLVFLGIFSLKVTNVSAPAQQITQIGNSQPYDNTYPDKPLPAVWSPGMEKDFQADVYYSKVSALRGIAVRLDKIVREKALNGEVLPPKISLVTYKDQFANGLLDEAVVIFQDMLPGTECSTVSAGTESFTYEDIWISFELAESSGQPQDNGTIKAAIHVKSTSTTASVTFTEKPWLENLAAYSNSMRLYQFATVHSQIPASTHDAARTQAETQALQLIKQKVLDYNHATPQSIRGKLIHPIAMEDLYAYGIIFDDFTQSLNSNNSNIWRHAILLNVTQDRIQALSLNMLRLNRAARQSWAYHIFSALGIAVVICLIYLILNAATRGYYTAVLRILTIAGIIATIILILNM